MSSQPVLVVIGIAIVVNLLIMGALLAMLVVRRRPMAAAETIVAPATYRYDMSQGAPTAVGPVTYMSDESDQSMGAMDEYQLAPDPTGVFRDPAPNPATPGRIETRIDDFYRAEGVPGDPAGAEPVPVPAPGEAITAGGPLAGSPTPAPVPAGPAFPAAATATTPEPSVATDLTPIPVGPIGDTDLVTGLDGPVVFDGRIRDEDARFSRYRRPVSVVLIELDGLDRLGDLLGPDARTRILRPVGQSIRRQARATDYIARIGDGRFAALLPETDEVQAINFVERVRTECDRWLASGAVSMRLAIGWSSPPPGSQLSAAMRVAQDRLDRDRRRPIGG